MPRSDNLRLFIKRNGVNSVRELVSRKLEVDTVCSFSRQGFMMLES
jgi:hypothetical protein